VGFQGASSWSAGCNLAVAVIGASIMGLPTTLKWDGDALGIALILGMGALTLVSALTSPLPLRTIQPRTGNQDSTHM